MFLVPLHVQLRTLLDIRVCALVQCQLYVKLQYGAGHMLQPHRARKTQPVADYMPEADRNYNMVSRDSVDNSRHPVDNL
jgi:hypothetical protein